jgi:hypothetical protein
MLVLSLFSCWRRAANFERNSPARLDRRVQGRSQATRPEKEFLGSTASHRAVPA